MTAMVLPEGGEGRLESPFEFSAAQANEKMGYNTALAACVVVVDKLEQMTERSPQNNPAD